MLILLGDQTHEEWDDQHEDGPNFGVNAVFTEHGTRPKKPKQATSNPVFGFVMSSDVEYEEAISMLRQSAPRDMLIHGEAIARNLALIKAKPFVHKYLFGPPDDNGVHAPGDFLRSPLIRTQGKSIFLHGPSAVGKTHFALAHFSKPLLVSDIDDLKKFNAHLHDGIVFDDMSFLHVPVEKVIHLVDQDFTRSIRCRHANASIPANTMKIFTHNTANPFFSDTGAYPPDAQQKIAIMRRLDCYCVPFSLFKPQAEENLIISCSLLDEKSEIIYHCDGQ